MPLLAGRKNIGRNIEVEQKHGKPHKQAVAIALNEARGSDGVKCQCESVVCGGHGDGSCANTATRNVPTIYGSYKMCRKCAEALPKEFMKANDELEPVGAEDPERAVALKKHEEGITRSQDVTKRARDIQGHEIREKLGISEAEWAKLDKSARQDKAREALRRGKDEVMPVGDAEGERKIARWESKSGKYWVDLYFNPAFKMANGDTIIDAHYRSDNGGGPVQAKTEADAIAVMQREVDRGRHQPDAAKTPLKRTKDELPTAVKTSNLVPMPSGEHNEVSYAPRRVGDVVPSEMSDAELEREIDQLVTKQNKTKLEVARLRFLMDEEVKREKAWGADTTQRFAKAGDAIQEQRSGSEPSDHMFRAAQYEIAGDRARALDSYRTAASGYRRANDRLGEQKARDGVEACQSRFAAQYDHPGVGRVKVCDSAEQAMRTAVERTRAGESVSVVGKTVRPGRARDASPMPTKWEAPKEKKGPHAFVGPQSTPYCFKCGESRHSPTHKSPAKDEHEGFKKLEGKLSHEKGVTNPAALAASIGRKKYGAAGMAKKSAAGRANDLKSSKSEAYEYAIKKGASAAEAERFAASYERASTNIGVREFASRTMAFKKATDKELQPVGDAATIEGVRNFEFTHGKPPRGDGSWCFSSKKDGPIEFEHRGSWAAAKSAAIKWANGKGLYGVWVLP